MQADYWQISPAGLVQCLLCPNQCQLKEGQRGKCVVRRAEAGRLVLDAHQRTSGLCIDPIEKKPLYHFHPGSATLSFGTVGCNLSCSFCQNWRISKVKDLSALSQPATAHQLVDAAQAQGCKSLAMTYNDPVIYLEFGRQIAKEAQAQGLALVAVTAGYIQGKAREEFFSWVDAANVDLKAFSPRFYRQLTRGKLEPVLESLLHIRQKTNCWLEITSLLIPGQNDSEAELKAQCNWIANELGPGTPLHFSAFHPDYKLLDQVPTPHATLKKAREIAQFMGLEHVYLGNVPDEAASQTHCPRCQTWLVRRQGYLVQASRLDASGLCPHCRAKIPGHFSPLDKAWGNRRQGLFL